MNFEMERTQLLRVNSALINAQSDVHNIATTLLAKRQVDMKDAAARLSQGEALSATTLSIDSVAEKLTEVDVLIKHARNAIMDALKSFVVE